MIISSDTHPFAQYVRILGKGKKGSRDLTQEEAQDAMGMIVRGEVEPEQLGAFLMLLRVKEESPAEIAGFCAAVREHWQLPNVEVDMDWSCYAGKRRHLPWLILSQKLLAEMGYRQAIHGTRGHTAERLYVQDVYEQLGMPVIRHLGELENWSPSEPTFIPLEVLSPRLESIIQLRKILGLRSPVHSFSRLLNPFNAPTVLQAIFHPGYHQIHQGAGALLGYQNALVVKGDGGEFERNPDADLTLFWAHSGVTSEITLPSLFTRRHVKPDALDIDHLTGLWKGTWNDEYAEAAVLSTAALAVMAHEGLDHDAAMERVSTAWQARSRT
ncbi:glycosyl transferase family protein [Salinispirillum sp. LH 10-3-1]|uniref:Glycosyl transferase family protein n=1 Tax=Salinispirillum sp. LH 10-3-1 TaxID=2952525 RepID=A0AB38YJJ4_9GAMM